MDYQGTAGNDDIDQVKLKLATGTNIYGGAGNDRISILNGNALGEAGDDTIIGGSGNDAYPTAAYWNSPKGVVVNLATGKAQDGFGTTDTLVNIRVVQGSPFADSFTGTAADESFWPQAGADTIAAGAGVDQVFFYNVKSTDCSISYVFSTDTFTIRKNIPGDQSTVIATGVERINFTGPSSDNVSLSVDQFKPGYFRQYSKTTLVSPSRETSVEQLAEGDFNGDGKKDLLVLRIDNQTIGSQATPLQILLGDGKGNFTEGSAQVFANGVVPSINYVPRIAVADFNRDGISDIFAPDFGYDAPPFPGGQNSLHMSVNGKLVNQTATLPQRLTQGHGLAIGDLNKDGYTDLLINTLHDFTGHANDIYYGGAGSTLRLDTSALSSYVNSTSRESTFTWSGIMDVNNDGYNDIIFGAWESNTADPSLLYLNDGKGNFPQSNMRALPASGVTGQNVMQVVQLDLNHDALPDLVLAVTNGGDRNLFYQTPYLQFLINEGNGQFRDESLQRLAQSKTATGGWYKFVEPVDLNGDGAVDLVIQAANSPSGTTTAASGVLLNDGSGNFVRLLNLNTSGSALHAMDVDGDGVMELVHNDAGELRIFRNDLPRIAHTITGTTANDVLTPQAGNDLVAGGEGSDMVAYSGQRNAYSVVRQNDVFFVKDATGTDTLVNVEKIRFFDVSIDLTVGAKAASIAPAALQSIAELYVAYFNRMPDAGGLAYWIDMYKSGWSLDRIGAFFYDAAIQPAYTALTGYSATMSNADFINIIYKNVLGRDQADAGGLAYWQDQLTTGQATRGSLVNSMLAAAHSFKGDATYGWVADLLDNKYAVAEYLAVKQGISFNGDASTYTKYVDISKAVTPTGIEAAVSLIGVTDTGFMLV